MSTKLRSGDRAAALLRKRADRRPVHMAKNLALPAMPRVMLEDVVHGPADAQDPSTAVGAFPRDFLVHVRVRNLGPCFPDEGASPGEQILVEGERLALEIGRPLRIRSEWHPIVIHRDSEGGEAVGLRDSAN